MSVLIPKPRTKFLRIKCPGCGNEQNVFSSPSTKIKCLVCDKELAGTTGGKIDLKTKIVRELEKNERAGKLSGKK